MPQFKPEAYEQNQKLLRMLEDMAAEHQATPAQISMACMICKKPWIVPIPGTRKLSRMEENAAAADIKLCKEEVDRLDKILDTIEMSEVFGGSKVK